MTQIYSRQQFRSARSGVQWCTFLFLALQLTTAAAADRDCPARQDFDLIIGAVTERFYDKTFRGLDWPARTAHARKAVRCGSTDAEVAARANDLLSELH